jgi:hypothetical protein
MNRYNQTISRSEFVRKRRSSGTTRQARKGSSTVGLKNHASTSSGHVSPIASLFLPVKPVKEARKQQDRFVNGSRQRYDAVFTVSKTRVHTPGITIPQFNPRWISAVLTAALVFLLYTLWNSSTFIFTGAEISGIQRLDANEINASLHLLNEPIFAAVPVEMENSLRSAFPDLSAVDVKVAFPNRVMVEVTERTPILAWYQNGALGWIDARGVAFPARGASDNLINIVANGTPPHTLDSSLQSYEQVYVPPQMVKALSELYPYVPAGIPMVYDPNYGMGWQDPRGWQVFFGQNTNDIALKVQAYQAIVEKLELEGRQPSVISIAYLDAPILK